MKRILLSLLAFVFLCSCQKPQPDNPVDPPQVDTIKYYEQCLFRPGDYGSTNWRIPAICCLPDGTLLITCDRRKYNETDLPEDIDIVSRRSTDNGRTWSEPVTIAQGTGRKHARATPSAAMYAAAPTEASLGPLPRTSPHSSGAAKPPTPPAATTAPHSSGQATACALLAESMPDASCLPPPCAAKPTTRWIIS